MTVTRDGIVSSGVGGGGGGGAGGGGGWVKITDANVTGGVASDKVYQDTGSTILQSFTASLDAVVLDVSSSYPIVNDGASDVELTVSADGGHYEGTVPITASATGDFTVQAKSADGVLVAIDTVTITRVAPPELLTLAFAGAYPGVQTELKAGDTFTLAGTTDVDATHIEVIDTEAGISQLIALPGAPTSAFSVSVTIADRGDVNTARPLRAKARNAVGAFGAERDTDELGGTTDGVDLVQCNNIAPSFVDNGTTFAGGAAFKGVEAGSQDTAVSDYDTLLYSSPHGDFTIGTPTVYVQDKPITCTNPGDYNDSATNFRIVATRAANDNSATFNKVIEVADVAAVITVTQPAARLRSGGNDGTSAQNHVITATSDQNLPAAPTIDVVVDGTWQGGGFVGGPKVWTRTLQVHDDDAKGTAAWTLTAPANNNAGTASGISGAQTNGGFVQRSLTFAAFSQTVVLNTEVVTYTKLSAGIFTATSNPALRNAAQGNTDDILDTYSITTLAVNPSELFWNDLAAANSNSSGTAQITLLEETV